VSRRLFEPGLLRSPQITSSAADWSGVPVARSEGAIFASMLTLTYTDSAMQKATLHPEHFVQFYDQDDFLLVEVSRFLTADLQAGDASLVIATPQHLEGLEQRLPGLARDRSRYLALDAASTLSQLMVNGVPDAERFQEVIGSALQQASRNGTRHVRAFGEMVSLLWEEGRHEAALRLEELWNDLAASCSFSLLCAYPMDGFHHAEHASSFLALCNAHSHVRPAESFRGNAGADDLHRQIAVLQQKATALETEIARRQDIERLLRQREQELSDFMENAVEGLHKVDADQKILWANKAELDMLGYEPGEYVGHSITEFHVDRDVIDDIWDKLRRGEALYGSPVRLRCKSGSIKYGELHSNALIEDGKLVYTRCYTRDVTDRVLLEAELQKRLDQLAESDQRKDEFLAMLGHELRNPLAAISTAAELMRLSDGPANLTRSRDIVARQAALMSRLVDDLLDISRINRGAIVLRTEEVLLREIIERAVETARPLIDQRNHHLSIDLPPEPVYLSGDRARLVQVVANLLNNAAKYTDPGGTIALSAFQDRADLLLCVRDNGIGLTEDLRARMFEPFVQAKDAFGRSLGGLGLGLTLVRKLVDLHSGRIEARSEGPGQGSEFVVCLPLPVAPAQADSAG
jgi:PAS domain S-box-containing protein